MSNRDSCMGFLGMAVAIFLLVGFGLGVAFFRSVAWSGLPSSSPPTTGARDQRLWYKSASDSKEERCQTL